MSAKQRKIIHCDCDCFFAAVEIRDNPVLADKPVAVGGTPEKRGVISTCNYIARKYGVHSAMASATAMKLCPKLIILRGDMNKYRVVSQQIIAIYREYTNIIEPLSLDEAFLDVSNSTNCKGSATLMAQEIREKIKQKTGITASAGIAPNKFLAKIASDWNKPDGQFVVLPEEIDDFVAELPVKKLFGVGKVTAEKMTNMGIETCADLQQISNFDLVKKFGTFGDRLYKLCRGIDNREVKTERKRKSLSVENTFETDLQTIEECEEKLEQVYQKLLTRAGRIEELPEIKTLFVKIKFYDFKNTTIECPGHEPDYDVFSELLEKAVKRESKAIRLIGIGVRFKEDGSGEHQMELFE
ncbi:MAG: DNA polymerase IV [Gammaproteobacteria bacterium]|nr:MAG: DNA polymerase IV [Gammaproteobacteria bacterium]